MNYRLILLFAAKANHPCYNEITIMIFSTCLVIDFHDSDFYLSCKPKPEMAKRGEPCGMLEFRKNDICHSN